MTFRSAGAPPRCAIVVFSKTVTNATATRTATNAALKVMLRIRFMPLLLLTGWDREHGSPRAFERVPVYAQVAKTGLWNSQAGEAGGAGRTGGASRANGLGGEAGAICDLVIVD